MRTAYILLAALLWAGCASPRGTLTAPPPDADAVAADAALLGAVHSLLADSLFPPALAGVSIRHAGSGVHLYALHPRTLFTPGSAMKTVTGLGALALLGESHPFNTEARADTVSGRIVVRGDGDPLFTTSDMDTLARQMAAALPPGRSWRLTGDVRAFTDPPWPSGWMWDDEPDPTAPFISPLSVNGNTVTVTVTPAAADRPAVRVDPLPAYHRVRVEARMATTADPADPLTVTRPPGGDGREIFVRGSLGRSDAPVRERVSVRDPAAFFLALLADRLSAAGVAAEPGGADVNDSLAGPPIARRTRTLDSIVTEMNLRSDNLAAECILRAAGGGSARTGIAAIRQALGARGLDTLQWMQADGSGASRYNLLSPDALVDLLRTAANDTGLGPLFRRGLPVAGRTGTLSSRMKGTSAEGRVSAKTGTLTGITALAGYATTADAEELAFAVMFQGIPGTVRPYRAVQDSLCVLLSRLRVRELLP